jgi:hypothetical protein
MGGTAGSNSITCTHGINRVGSNDGGKTQAPNTARHVNRIARHGTAQHGIASTHTHGAAAALAHTSRHALPSIGLGFSKSQTGQREDRYNCREGWPDILTNPSPLLRSFPECVRCFSFGLRLVLRRDRIGGGRAGWRPQERGGYQGDRKPQRYSCGICCASASRSACGGAAKSLRVRPVWLM